MPRSRRYRKSSNKDKPEWGKNNPRAKAKNRKILIALGVIAIVVVALSAFVVLKGDVFFGTPQPFSRYISMPAGVSRVTSPAGEYSNTSSVVMLQTSMGNITIQMRDDKPITTTNFVDLVKSGFYDGTVFHRIVAGFMIQGGQNDSANAANIQDEIGNDNVNFNGTIAMANTGQPDSASSQFFINVADNSNQSSTFDSSYTVFGRVIGGMDVVMHISEVPVVANPSMNNEMSQPVNPVNLIRAYIVTP